MDKRKLVLFGSSGGLGTGVLEYLQDEYDVTALSSKDIDLTDIEQVHNFFKENSFDIVVNLSGYNYDTFLHKITSENIAEVNKVIDVTVKGNINLLSACLPSMRQNKYGRVILISSVLAEKAIVSTSVYSASKSFVDTLVRVASAENISKGITCNSIRLGYFDAGMCHRLNPNIATNIKNSIGLQRWGSLKELFQTIDYFIKTEYITGQNITISGGLP
jgi:3-oxoacyl-[acyl-carrier protein] reductase